jgi:spermidine/putrescine transport system substrate-binding protein
MPMNASTKWRGALAVALAASLLAACAAPASPPAPTPPPLADELILYDWPEDYPQSVLDAFSAEYGAKVTYLTYESQEEAAANIRAGQVYDVVVMENQLVPALIADGLLAEIDFRNVPNFKNISPNFRDLASDPNNRHTIPFTWGTSGLVIRTDLVETPPTRWTDLWETGLPDKVVMWNLQRYLIGIALKSLGYSINSEDPVEL